MSDADRGRRAVVGAVIDAALDKTVTIIVERRVKHPLYGKTLRRSTKLYAHDEENKAVVGDVVKIESCRPLSKSKRWKLVQVLGHAR